MAERLSVSVIDTAKRAVPSPNHTRCRVCGAGLPSPFLDLGPMPLANSFLRSLEEAAAESRYPLAVCCCQRCGLVQLNHVVPAEQLYRNYIYVSSTSEAVRAHAKWLAAELIRRYGWTAADLLVEVASNDGTVLRAFREAGLPVLGVEPAANVAAMAAQAGVPTVMQFFNAATARALAAQHGRAACILGRHVFAHVHDVHDFLEGVLAALADDGVFLIEVPYLGDLITNLEFDTIYHEHLSYFALDPIVRLCRDHGLELVDVDRVTLHGGSVLLHMRRRGVAGISPRLSALLQEERRLRLAGSETFRTFAERVHAWRERLAACLREVERAGGRIIGYGAAAKANTLLNFCPEEAARLSCVLDRSPLKHGRYSPGTHLPVKPVEEWRHSGATHILILAWNFKDEIMRQLRPFTEQGGRFIVPIPEPTVE